MKALASGKIDDSITAVLREAGAEIAKNYAA
jgi:hypothetical protein